jgi:DNA replication and repair protein RecF
MLSAFRSYDQLTFSVDERPVVLTGPNGAGKTNILEALSLFSPGRGLRSAKMSDLNRQGPGNAGSTAPAVPATWAISGTLRTDGDEVVLGTGLGAGTNGDPKRIVRIDGEGQSGPSAFAPYLSIVWLTPAMDRLFQEGAGARRRFFDRLVIAGDSGHATRYASFERAMRERQKLLESMNPDAAWLTSLETTMAENAVAVAAVRRDFLANLVGEIDAAATSDDLFPRADLALACPLNEALEQGQSALEIEDTYALSLSQGRVLDRAAGRALLGPHRTDLVVHHRTKGVAAKQCSTGEQKALLIGLVLANARLKKTADQGPAPLLLLDEIAAHLDPRRRAALFDEICAMGSQAWMTGTDEELFSSLGDRAQCLTVKQSEIC